MIDFYDVDINYIKFLQRAEIETRGFTRVPNMEYGNRQQKFLCGVVLEINNIKFYVPVTSSKENFPDSIEVKILSDRYNQVKGTLKFNYMIPVPDCAIKKRVINLEPDPKRKRFLQEQLLYCQSIEKNIFNQAHRTYNKRFANYATESFLKNSCDFALLENKCAEYNINM